MKHVGVKEAKNKFSELLQEAKEAPVTITLHGKPDSVVMSYELYNQLIPKQSGLDLFAGFDWSDIALELQPDVKQRELELD